MPERVACYQCADLYALCRLGQRRQHGPAFPDSTGRLVRITIEEMVRKPDAIESISPTFTAFSLEEVCQYRRNDFGPYTVPLTGKHTELRIRNGFADCLSHITHRWSSRTAVHDECGSSNARQKRSRQGMALT